MTGIEPVNLFLTKEALYRLSYMGFLPYWSGRRGSNSRHSAWKADALPTELLPHILNGANGGIRTPDRLITNQQLCQLSYVGVSKRTSSFNTIPFQKSSLFYFFLILLLVINLTFMLDIPTSFQVPSIYSIFL